MAEPDELLLNITEQVNIIADISSNNAVYVRKFWVLCNEMVAFNTMINVMVLFALLFITFTFIFKKV